MAAKRPPDESRHECVFIKIEQAEQVIPAVQLEQREIKMTYPPSEQSLPCIITTSVDNNNGADRIVGEERPLGDGSFATSTSGVQQQNGHHEEMEISISRRVEHQSTASPHTEVSHANVLEYFEEQGKTFQEKGFQPRLKTKKPRSASPSPIRQSVGLDHLDHLVKLMEQMSNLREENVKLKKKCDYLESTKTLLQVKTELNSELGYNSLPTKGKAHKSKNERKHHRPRLSSAEDVELDIDIETFSEKSPKRPKAAQLQKRSFSTGSLEVPCDIMEHSGEEEIIEPILSKSYDKSKTESKIGHSGSKKSKKSNWARIKTVLTKKLPEYSLKSRKDLGRSVHHGHTHDGSVGTTQELTVPITTGVLESRSVDSGVGSGMEADGHEVQRKSTSSGESPSAFSSQPGVPSGEVGKDDDDDLYMGIWMGPPEWQEQHKEEMQIGNSFSVSENKEVIILKSSKIDSDENHLQVPMPRRKSSPSLIDHDDRPMELDGEEYSRLRRSSSYKGRSSHGEVFEEMPASPKFDKKLHKKTWERVKTMVSTRKDSVKKKITRRHGKTESAEELSEMDIDKYGYEHLEGPISRSTPKTSPMAIRQRREKSMSDSPPGYKGPVTSSVQVTQMGGVIDLHALMGGMSDPEFSKKLQQWEEIKIAKRLSAPMKDSSDEAVFSDSVGTTSPEFQKKTEDKDRSKSLKSVGSQEYKEERSMRDISREGSPDGTATPPESLAQVTKLEELFNRKLTDSFNRKLEEWEKFKYRKEGSPSLGRKDSATKSSVIRKDDRQKSRKSKEEKDREKIERLRGRELQRVEREEHKLEKEKIRLEKERLKALEREARIEKMKGRLSQQDMEAKFKNPVLSPLAEYKVTTDFARKLHEWELIKGSPGNISTVAYLEAHRGLEHSFQSDYASLKKDSFEISSSSADEPPRTYLAKGQKPPPLTLQPCPDSPEEVSPVCRSSDASSIDGTEDDDDDQTSMTTEGLTDSNITSLEKANIKLLEELQKKEVEYAALQEEVRDINEKLEKIKDQHSKDIERYQQEIGTTGQGMANLPSPSSVTTLSELQDKISELKDFGEDLAVSMESAAFCKIKSIEGEGSVNTRLMELLEQMRIMLLQASQTEEISQKSSALHSFEKLYGQAMQLQVQLNNLRLSQLERNKEIMTMKRQLLLQEANNLLLQADITRRETELHYYRQYARRNAHIKRWNTYGGMESRVVEGKEADHIPPYKRFAQSLKEPGRPPIVCSDDILERTEHSTSGEPSREETSLKIDDSSSQPLEACPNIHSKALASSRLDKVESPITSRKHNVEFTENNLIEIDHTEKYIKQKKSEDTVVVKDESRTSGDGVEISLTITLPTASVSMPRDISQQELAVPRSHRSKESSPTDIYKSVEKPENIDSNLPRAETKFPELLIPDWRKTPERGHLKRTGNVEESEPDSWVQSSVDSHTECSFVDSRTESSFDSRKSFTSEYSRTDAESQTMDDTDDNSFQHETAFYKPPHLTKQQALERSSPKATKNMAEITITKGKHTGHIEKIVVTTKVETVASQQSPVYSKTMQMHVHWPQIKHAPIVHRIKPNDELLLESQRYRKGHSIYMTRILQKYAVGDNTRKYYEAQRSLDKENIAEGYVQSMIKRLSREGTPDHGKNAGESSPKMVTISSQKPDSPRARSEFVQHIVRKLSSPSGPEHTRTVVAPLKDLTNGASGKKVRQLAEAFDSGGTKISSERAFSDSECPPLKSVISKCYHRPHDSLNLSFDSSSQSTITSHSLGTADQADGHKPDSTISATMEFHSLPLISVREEDPYKRYRERAATTTTCDTDAEQGIKNPNEKQEVHVTIMSVPPSGSSEHEAAHGSEHPEEVRHVSETTVFPKRTELRYPHKLIYPRGKIKMGTIGVLCQQTMLSFDLGMSLQAAEAEKSSEVVIRRADKRQRRPLSEGSIEGSEIPPTSADEKRKSRTKFFEASWFHKPKRFFKVSKC